MKPPSLPPRVSPEQSGIFIQEFLSKRTERERQILEQLVSYPINLQGQQLAYTKLNFDYGEEFRFLLFEFQSLKDACGCGYADLIEMLIPPLNSGGMLDLPSPVPPPPDNDQEVPISVRTSVDEVINPFAHTVVSSNPPPDEPAPQQGPEEAIFSSKKVPMPKQSEADKLFLKEMYQFIDDLPDEQKKMLPYLTGPRPAVTDEEPQIGSRKRVNFLSLDMRFSSFIKRRGRTRDEAKEALSEALKSVPPELENDSGVRTKGGDREIQEQTSDTQKRRSLMARILKRQG